MNKKPIYFNLLSALILLLILGIPAQVMWLYEHPLRDMNLAFEQLPWNNLLFMGAGIIVSIQTFIVHPQLKISIPAFALLGIFNNLLVGLDSLDYSFFETTIASVALVSIFVPILHPSQMKLIENSKLHWWTRSPRAELLIPAQIETKNQHLRAITFDLSDTGVFLTFNSLNQIMDEFEELDRLEINLKLDQLQTLRCQAQVIRVSQKQFGDYPPGVGLKFLNTSEAQKRELRRLVKRQLELELDS